MRDPYRVRRPLTATTLVLGAAEATWWTADRIRDAGELLERTAGATANLGHRLLDAWADRCERRHP